MPPVERYPQLVIVPKDDSESFEMMIKSGPKNTDIEYIGRVEGIRWDVDGPSPSWTMKHQHIKTKPDKRIPNLPSAPTKKQLVVLGAKHFFGIRNSQPENSCVY
jgi:hypothetical protein